MYFNHTAKNSLVQMPIPASDGHTNGHTTVHTDGHHNDNQLHNSTSTIETNDTVRHNASRTISRKTSSSSHTHNFSSTQKVTVLRQTVTITRSKLIDFLTHVDEHYIDSMTVESFLEYIETERLTYMPRQGSRWDKVLKWAEFFALQISGYEKRVESFVPDSKSAAKLILAACRVLIEVCTQTVLHATRSPMYLTGNPNNQLTLRSLEKPIHMPSKRRSPSSTKSDSHSRSSASTTNFSHSTLTFVEKSETLSTTFSYWSGMSACTIAAVWATCLPKSSLTSMEFLVGKSKPSTGGKTISSNPCGSADWVTSLSTLLSFENGSGSRIKLCELFLVTASLPIAAVTNTHANGFNGRSSTSLGLRITF
jgi:hypothetical protein